MKKFLENNLMIEPNTLAPIVIFVFNRLEHTKKTLEALKNNTLAKESDLVIYSDAAKKTEDKKKVNQVRKYLKNLSGFKRIQIINRKNNYGLAKSIKHGIKEIINKYGKIIVLEDDIETGKYFLTYMNQCLKIFYKNKEIWHINGWNYPKNQNNNDSDIIFDSIMNCWGWATWRDRWRGINFNSKKLIKKFDLNMIYKINLENHENFYSQLLANHYKLIDTWAIFWMISIFINNGICVRPKYSLTKNIGLDNSGIHCSKALINYYNNQNILDIYYKNYMMILLYYLNY